MSTKWIGCFDEKSIVGLSIATIVLISSSVHAEDLDCGIEAKCSALYFGATTIDNEVVPGCGVRITPHIPERLIEAAKLKDNQGAIGVKVSATWKLVDGEIRGASTIVKYMISSNNGVRELDGMLPFYGVNLDGDFAKSSLPIELTLVECRLLEQ